MLRHGGKAFSIHEEAIMLLNQGIVSKTPRQNSLGNNNTPEAFEEIQRGN